ncbi:rhodanese-like domain-containing protein [Haladaptatus halobius]|uniref:rhodanese-like domain-containing protein n=1 Tax=Haladaptatus halobius TaxID=2884875 RepID=UPI001D09E528|nr:rhodanese-like domain-containing protein [Haladaptatus halobius]
MAGISPEELRTRRQNDANLRIVDIRSPGDYEEEHIEGSENLPVREALLSGNVDEALELLDNLPADAEIVTVCDAGHVSGETANMLREQGYDAKALDNGLEGWKQSSE